MARPSAAVITELHAEGDINDIILAVGSVYALTYKGNLVSIRREGLTMQGRTLKYPKTQWPQEGTAKNVVRRLNAQHMTDDFGYICLYKQEQPVKETEPIVSANDNYEAN